ncbi:hypothetical protein ATCC90586_004874 [Pythium insidiosum]|nr:hypothetical protein ATCC90586_004874 [Pythium insidiosum]
MKLSTVLMAAALVFSASLVEDAAAFRPLRDGTNAEEGDLIETEPVVVPQNYTTADALEEAARKAGPAIFSELSSDASQFGVGGAQTLVVIAAVAGAVAIVFGVLIAVVGALRPSQVVLDDCRPDAVETGSVQILPRIPEESEDPEDPEETAEHAQEQAQEEQEGTFLNGDGLVPV